MSKRAALTMMLIAGGVEIYDKASGGKVFGTGGMLASIDAIVPKITVGGITTDLAIWAIVAGAIIYFL